MKYQDFELYERLFVTAMEDYAEGILAEAYDVDYYNEDNLFSEAIELLTSEQWADIYTAYLEGEGFSEEEVDNGNRLVYRMTDNKAMEYTLDVISDKVKTYVLYSLVDLIEEEEEHREEEEYASSNPYEYRGLTPELFF